MKINVKLMLKILGIISLVLNVLFIPISLAVWKIGTSIPKEQLSPTSNPYNEIFSQLFIFTNLIALFLSIGVISERLPKMVKILSIPFLILVDLFIILLFRTLYLGN